MKKLIVLLIIGLCVSGCIKKKRNTHVKNTYQNNNVNLTCCYLKSSDHVAVAVSTNLESQLIRLDDDSFLEVFYDSVIFHDVLLYPGTYVYELHAQGEVAICEVTKPMPIYEVINNGNLVETCQLQKWLNNITWDYNSDISVNNDYLTKSDYWRFKTGASGMLLVELAGFAKKNKFGIYDKNDPSIMTMLFEGIDSEGASLKLTQINGIIFVNNVSTNISSDNFGFWLDSSYYSRGGLFFSDSNLNNNGEPHMIAYQGSGDRIVLPDSSDEIFTSENFMLCWEDLYANPDWDYTDMSILIKGIFPNEE